MLAQNVIQSPPPHKMEGLVVGVVWVEFVATCTYGLTLFSIIEGHYS